MSPMRAGLRAGARALCLAASVVAILLVLGGNMSAALLFIGLALAGLAASILL